MIILYYSSDTYFFVELPHPTVSCSEEAHRTINILLEFYL